MAKNKFTARVVADLPAGKLHRLYDVLEDEETPYSARVKNGVDGKHITIFCREKDVAYFNSIIWAL